MSVTFDWRAFLDAPASEAPWFYTDPPGSPAEAQLWLESAYAAAFAAIAVLHGDDCDVRDLLVAAAEAIDGAPIDATPEDVSALAVNAASARLYRRLNPP